jgi:hypothetical protein
MSAKKPILFQAVIRSLRRVCALRCYLPPVTRFCQSSALFISITALFISAAEAESTDFVEPMKFARSSMRWALYAARPREAREGEINGMENPFNTASSPSSEFLNSRASFLSSARALRSSFGMILLCAFSLTTTFGRTNTSELETIGAGKDAAFPDGGS